MANTTADKLALAAANKVAIKAAINAKNPATAPTDVMSQWPTAIASIPTGGWNPPEWIPDIRAILKNVLDNNPQASAYPHRYIALYACEIQSVSLTGSQAYVVDTDSETVVYGGTATWSDKDFHWVIFLSDSAITFPTSGNGKEMTWLHADNLKLSTCNHFLNSNSRVEIITGVFDTTEAVSFDGFLSNNAVANALYVAPEGIDTRSSTNFGLFFYGGTIRFKFTLDLRSITSSGSLSRFMENARFNVIPDILGSSIDENYSINIPIARTVDRDSFARFTNGTLDGGAIFHLNDVRSETYTRILSLGSSLRSYFSDAEATQIVSHANGLGWTLTNFSV